MEVSLCFSNSEGNRVARVVNNKGFRGVMRPNEVASEREEMGECVRERVFEGLEY